jgi:hypothetical protein
MNKIILFLLLALIVPLKSFAVAPAVHIDSITPYISEANEPILIKGSGFGSKQEDISVTFKTKLQDCPQSSSYTGCEETKEYNVIVTKIADNQIEILTPTFSEKSFFKVVVSRKDNGGLINSNEVDFASYYNSLVDESIILKESGMNDAAIVDHLSFQMISDDKKGSVNKESFGNVKVSANDQKRLKVAGLSDDYISKLQGEPQRVTIGLAGVWLPRTSELVPAPMIRILLTPRSYFYERKAYMGEIPCLTGCLKGIPFPNGLFDLATRWDLNFGITSSTPSTKSSDSQTKKTNYFLVGFSNEINAAAFLNVGMALAIKDLNGVVNPIKRQWYLGVTIDSNFLKVIGITEK